MKLLVLALALVILACPAEARLRVPDYSMANKFHSSPACERLFWFCRSHHPDRVQDCQMLWDAARKTGIFGAPEARVAARIRGRQFYCEN